MYCKNFQGFVQQGLAVFLCMILVQISYAASISRHAQTVSGLEGWLIQDENIEIQLNPLKRAQVRAFYLGRGFSNEISEQIVKSCVYQMVIKNTSSPDHPAKVTVNLDDWRLIDGQEAVALKSKQEWLEKWGKLGASPGAMIAFKWATFPRQQFFEQSGDYGWGMILFAPQAGEIFNLELKWTVDDVPFEQVVEQLICVNE